MNAPNLIDLRDINLQIPTDFGPVRQDFTGMGWPQLHIFERHLEICPECEAYLDSYRKTVSLGEGCHDVTPAVADIPDALVSAILEARQSETPNPASSALG